MQIDSMKVVEGLDKINPSPGLSSLLACPECHGSLKFSSPVQCTSCDFSMAEQDGIFLRDGQHIKGTFDKTYLLMGETQADPGTNTAFYDAQSKWIEKQLSSPKIILDVGCGISVPYKKNSESLIIGLDPSFLSLTQNRGVDLKIAGGAQSLPLKEASVDMIVCLYSVHHMVKSTISETRENVRKCLLEFKRVLKPNGSILIFEVNPWRPFSLIEKLVWNLCRKILGKRLDMYFWSVSDLSSLLKSIFPEASLEKKNFNTSLFETFPPVLTMPYFRVPRFMYPFDVNCFQLKASSKPVEN